MTRAEWDALIARVEVAEGPSRELDAEIAVAISGDPGAMVVYDDGSSMFSHQPGWWCDGNNKSHHAPAPTASLDAAAALVPEGWIWWVNSRNYARCWTIENERVKNTAQSPLCATPALALTAAALRARMAMMEGEG